MFPIITQTGNEMYNADLALKIYVDGCDVMIKLNDDQPAYLLGHYNTHQRAISVLESIQQEIDEGYRYTMPREV